ncbi:MAG: acyl-ACP--UDP-N-acetylglucosamine O-acyltransferase [Elusimicrobia bacterium]|nr:acyl-ACP--UDP-N-acetylglucosamine O-acyltransferase [Elusimicrobiota bacterium]
MIHNTAIIHPSAKIAKDVEIGPYAIIGENTIIKSGVKIDSGAIVENAEIGENCQIYSYAVIGTAPQSIKYKNEPTKLILGSDCIVREFVTLNRGTDASGKTIIGSNCYFMAYSHIAHDCIVGNNVTFANVATIGGHVEVGDNAFLGGIVVVHQFCRIGKFAMLGGGTGTSQDILPFTMVVGPGHRTVVMGLNLVGIRRDPKVKDALEDIKSAYRTLFFSKIPLKEALNQLEVMNLHQEVKEMIDFIKTSKRGFCKPNRFNKEEQL